MVIWHAVSLDFVQDSDLKGGKSCIDYHNDNSTRLNRLKAK